MPTCFVVSVQIVDKVEEQVGESLPEVSGVPCIGVSALMGEGCDEVLPTALQAFRVWNQRVPTARLNRWLIAVRSFPAREVFSSSPSSPWLLPGVHA